MSTPGHRSAGGLVLQPGRARRTAQSRQPTAQHPGECGVDLDRRRALWRSVPVSGAGRRSERLGEWRRDWDALGLGQEDFGPNSGVLFERPEALVERADRLEERARSLDLIDAAERNGHPRAAVSVVAGLCGRTG